MSAEPADNRQDWMSDAQWECACLIAEICGGWHHVDGKIKQCGTGIRWGTRQGRWATFDCSELTRLVVLAHDFAIRVEVVPWAPGMLGFTFHKRARKGRIHQRHPTIQDAVAAYSFVEHGNERGES